MHRLLDLGIEMDRIYDPDLRVLFDHLPYRRAKILKTPAKRFAAMACYQDQSSLFRIRSRDRVRGSRIPEHLGTIRTLGQKALGKIVRHLEFLEHALVGVCVRTQSVANPKKSVNHSVSCNKNRRF